MSERPTAAIVTVGSELVEGLRVDTNTAEIARDVSRFGFRVDEAVSAGKIQHGDLVLMVVFGAGLTWGAAVIEW